jgi:hypothetical protein
MPLAERLVEGELIVVVREGQTVKSVLKRNGAMSFIRK